MSASASNPSCIPYQQLALPSLYIGYWPWLHRLVKLDVSLANLSSLLSSMGSAGDLAQKVDQEADMEVSTAGAKVQTGINRL